MRLQKRFGTLDRDFLNGEKNPRVGVLLDGHIVQHCTVADEEAGIVWVRYYDKDWNPLLTFDNSMVAERPLFGRVEIIINARYK